MAEPPVPVDEIIEVHLQLTFEMQDLQQLFELGDIHGATWINEGRVAVDQSLDPHNDPRKLGKSRGRVAKDITRIRERFEDAGLGEYL